MKYLLDTCTISDFVKGNINTLNKIKSIEPYLISVSTITSMEIYYGLKRNPEKASRIEEIIQGFLDTIHILPFDQEDAKYAGNIRADLFSQGLPIGAYDILIAATALKKKLILVTSNTKEFLRVKNLSLQNWRDS